jgi:cobalt-zinc-cadmium efflux system outer membrane protein
MNPGFPIDPPRCQVSPDMKNRPGPADSQRAMPHCPRVNKALGKKPAMRWREFLVVAAVIAAGLPPCGRAETAAAEPLRLSLTQARALAFQRNWDLLAAKSDVSVAEAQRLVAREFPNPTASFSVTKINVDSNPNSTASGNEFWDRSYDTVAAINQLIEIGGKRKARKASAAAGLKGAEARLSDARRLLDQGVTQAGLAVLLADRNRAVLTDSAASLRREAKIAGARQAAGDISLADKSQIEIAADRIELDAATAEAEAHKARVALEVLLGERKPTGTLQLSDSLESLAQPTGNQADAATAALSRPDVRAAEAAREKAEADLSGQKAARIPDPTILAQYEHEPPDQPQTVGFGVSFPLPLWNRNAGNIAAAAATREQAETQLEKARAQAFADIVSARATQQAAFERWRRYHEDLAPKSAQIRESVAFAYEKGGAALLDLLAAQRNDNEVRLATAQAAADAANATASLRAALNLTDTPATK